MQLARGALAAAADPAKAGPMAAYMKTDMPFYGVQKPQRAAITRRLTAEFPPTSDLDFDEKVRALWVLPFREEKYLAIAYTQSFSRYLVFRHVGLFERMITEGAWWDLVDDLASRTVGPIVATERDVMRSVLVGWVDDDDMWLRRSAIICQLRHRADTDASMLFDFCLRRAHESEFFVRKAIGWALREYSKTDPAAVAEFLVLHGDRLSSLSVREASRRL